MRTTNIKVNGGDYPKSYDSKSLVDLQFELAEMKGSIMEEDAKYYSGTGEMVALQHDIQVLELYIHETSLVVNSVKDNLEAILDCIENGKRTKEDFESGEYYGEYINWKKEKVEVKLHLVNVINLLEVFVNGLVVYYDEPECLVEGEEAERALSKALTQKS